MDLWTVGLVAVIVVGLALIVYGALRDRARNRRAREEMLSPPKRDIPRFRPDSPAPRYLSELQARRPPADTAPADLSEEERQTITVQLRETNAITVGVGYASKSFLTDPTSGWAVLDEPSVLVCAGPVQSIRELLPILERAAMAQQAVVIAAPSIADDVLATLEVNAIQRKLRLLTLAGSDKHSLATIAAHTGARPLDRSDLQAGYIPDDHLGRCRRWVSDKKQSWVLPEASSGLRA